MEIITKLVDLDYARAVRELDEAELWQTLDVLDNQERQWHLDNPGSQEYA